MESLEAVDHDDSRLELFQEVVDGGQDLRQARIT